MKIFAHLLFLILFCHPGPIQADTDPPSADSEPDMISNMDKSVVQVVVPLGGDSASSGSGFVLNQDGYIATNHHVINDGKAYLIATNGDAQSWPSASLIWSSEEKDLAILKADGLNRPSVTLYMPFPAKLSKVIAFGFPGAANRLIRQWGESTASDGAVSKMVEAPWEQSSSQTLSIIQHTAPINHGNSGGPLFDACGRVIGVNTQKAITDLAELAGGSVVTGIYYASHISVLADVLKSKNISFNLAADACPMAGGALSSTGIPISWMIGTSLLAISSMVMVLRRPRQIIMQKAGTYSRVLREQLSRRDGGRKDEWVLSGFDSDGRAVRVGFSMAGVENDEEGLIIGRSPHLAHWVLEDDTLSLRHARIIACEGNLYIEDLNTSNGTVVAGRNVSPFKPMHLTDGGKMILGGVALTLHRNRS